MSARRWDAGEAASAPPARSARGSTTVRRCRARGSRHRHRRRRGRRTRSSSGSPVSFRVRAPAVVCDRAVVRGGRRDPGPDLIAVLALGSTAASGAVSSASAGGAPRCVVLPRQLRSSAEDFCAGDVFSGARRLRENGYELRVRDVAVLGAARGSLRTCSNERPEQTPKTCSRRCSSRSPRSARC